MQQQDGFLAKPKTSPTTIGIVIAAHVAVLGAVILAPPDFVRPPIVFNPLKLDNVKDPVPPPPEPPQPIQRSSPRPTMPDPLVTTTTQPETTVTLFPPVDLRPQPTFDQPVSVDPPKIATPVIVAPQYDQRYADQLQPSYPTAMARAEIEGSVTVRVLVGTDGRVKQVEVLAATDPSFAESTTAQALKRWRFKPSTKDGAPTEGWVTMRLRFVLTNN
jgi:protein TonB